MAQITVTTKQIPYTYDVGVSCSLIISVNALSCNGERISIRLYDDIYTAIKVNV